MFAIEWHDNQIPKNAMYYEYNEQMYYVQEIEEKFLVRIMIERSLPNIGFLSIVSKNFLFFPFLGGISYSSLCNQKRNFNDSAQLAKILLFQLMEIDTEQLVYYLDKKTIFYDEQFIFLVGINTTMYEQKEGKRVLYLVTSLLLDLLENTKEFQARHLHPSIYHFIKKHEEFAYHSLQEIVDDVLDFDQVLHDKRSIQNILPILKIMGKVSIAIAILLSIVITLIPIAYYFTPMKEELTSIGDVVLK